MLTLNNVLKCLSCDGIRNFVEKRLPFITCLAWTGNNRWKSCNILKQDWVGGLPTNARVERYSTEERHLHVVTHLLSTSRCWRKDVCFNLEYWKSWNVKIMIKTTSKINAGNTLHLGQTKPLMFSTTPTIGTFTFRQKFTSFRTSNNDTSYNNNNNNVSSHTRTGVPRDLPEVL